MRLLGVIACYLLLHMFTLQAMAVEVVANVSVKTARLSLAEARAIFAMRRNTWPAGAPVRVFVLADSHPLHISACKERLNLFPYQLRQSWDRLVFSGMGQAPKEVASEEELVALVASTPGAIGYVSRINDTALVKVIHVE